MIDLYLSDLADEPRAKLTKELFKQRKDLLQAWKEKKNICIGEHEVWKCELWEVK